jgi:hypothetical protein
MKKHILAGLTCLSIGTLSAQSPNPEGAFADVTTKGFLVNDKKPLLKGTYTRGKGLEAIQTANNTVVIDYNASTVEHNGVLYPILASDCRVYPPSVNVTYGRILLTVLTIYYNGSGWYAGHSTDH